MAEKAYYKEGDTAFIRKVRENIAYPAEARQLKFQATLIVKFLVRRDSTVGEVQVIQGFAEDTPPEFRRQIEDIINNAVLVASPQGAWIAAQNNQKQAVAMTKKVPIVFLPHKEEE
ncbi:MAG: energy transducer TonB [Raineya sp.]